MRNLILIIVYVLVAIACKNDASDKDPNQTISVTLIDNPVEGNSSLPRLFSNGRVLYMSWVEQRDTLSILKYAKRKKESWDNVVDVNGGTDWFVNWADFPAIAENNGNVLTNYLKKSDTATYAYDIRMNLYYAKQYPDVPRDTIGWKRNFIMHDDSTKTEHGFVSIIPIAGKRGWYNPFMFTKKANSFFVSWLDGRNTGGSHNDQNDHGPGAMTLRGALVGMYGDIIEDVELDTRVCDCCQTSATITANGPLVAYRDRSEEEIRDISVVRQVDGQWLEPQTVGNDNWEIAGCPVNGPSVDAYMNAVGLAWFTAARGEGEVQVVFSEDDGTSFGQPIRVDSGFATGRVDIEMLNASEAAVLWMEPDGEDEVIRVMKVSSDGKKGNLVTVSRTSPERASGFPQIELVGEELIFAWTDVSEDTSSIKTAVLSLDKL